MAEHIQVDEMKKSQNLDESMPPPFKKLVKQQENVPEEFKDLDKKVTPSVVRTRQFRNVFPVTSPSDSIMSPCTQKLTGRAKPLREKDHFPKLTDRFAKNDPMDDENK